MRTGPGTNLALTNGVQPKASNGRPTESTAPRIVVVTSGKGGVGKTNIVANLAVSLASFEQRVVVLDADYGLGNLDLVFGLEPALTIESVLDGQATLAEVAVEAGPGVRVVPAASGAPELAFLSNEQRLRLEGALSELNGVADWLLVDTATGISENVVSWLQLADETVLISATDPAAIIDAYAMAKLVARLAGSAAPGLIVNSVADEREAMDVHARLDHAAREFLGGGIDYLGHVVRDAAVTEALRQQRPLVSLLPTSAASRCFRRLARRLLSRVPPNHAVVREPELALTASH